MKLYSMNFRNFKNVSAGFSYYPNGNVCLEIFSEDVRLCELSKDVGYKVSSLILKNMLHNDIFIYELMSAGLISAFTYHNSLEGTLLICNLSYKVTRDLKGSTERIAVAEIV